MPSEERGKKKRGEKKNRTCYREIKMTKVNESF